MKQRHLGRSGLIVSRLALGTMTWGGDTDEDDAAAQLVAFREAGGTLVDTADVYVGGESEPGDDEAAAAQVALLHGPDASVHTMKLGLNMGYWGMGNDAANLELAKEADALGYSVAW
ncbi:MAG: hypothetical protein QOI82_816, partial [Actinomycetota bacterium]|nr:hypothetical protein [Actinomycetota bacterium]